MDKTFSHPNPTFQKISQYGGALVLGVLVVAFVLQLVLAVLLKGFLFILTAVTILLFAPFIVMLITATSPIRVTDEGITVMPLVWRTRTIAWGDVLAIKPYTLLPQPDQEMERRALQGKRKYSAPQGKMLVVRGLPWQYRMAGFFAGEGGKTIIVVTNRTHVHYDQLVKVLEQHIQPN